MDDLEIRFRFARTFRKYRAESGLKQAECAEKAGLTQAAISQYENGTRIPSIIDFYFLTRALGFDGNKFLQEMTSTEGV